MSQLAAPRSKALALLGSAAVMLVVTASVWSGVMPVDADIRMTVGLAFTFATIVDLLVGIWLLSRSR